MGSRLLVPWEGHGNFLPGIQSDIKNIAPEVRREPTQPFITVLQGRSDE